MLAWERISPLKLSTHYNLKIFFSLLSLACDKLQAMLGIRSGGYGAHVETQIALNHLLREDMLFQILPTGKTCKLYVGSFITMLGKLILGGSAITCTPTWQTALTLLRGDHHAQLTCPVQQTC